MATIIAVPLAASTGCIHVKFGHYADDKKAALAALDVFHQQLGAGDFDAIYENASDEFRAQPKSELIQAMKDSYQKWGKLIRTELKSSSCFPNEVRFIVVAQLEKGEAGEMIIWSVPDEKARLLSYEIFPGPVVVPSGSANECR